MKLERTADGSYTLYVPELDEHYHSVKGALTESQHIFIEMGLKHSSVPEPRILEIGLGTGLNAFLTLISAEEIQRKVHYTGIERYPLAEDTWRKLDYPGIIGKGHEEEYRAIHTAAWGEDAVITPWFTLHKVEGDFTEMSGEGECILTHPSVPSQEGKMDTPAIDDNTAADNTAAFDIIYFDAFAPEKQPEMWEQSLFNTLYKVLNEGGILTTYCAKGVVRRMLQAAGFLVERLPGPPGGKREILRATKRTL
jgi:tRNA U34 5-methylaminomethyl-2-thiouridine-forming methyltransferase MnmC